MGAEEHSWHDTSDSCLAGYAARAPQEPHLKAYDFERLYTNIHLRDMFYGTMHLVSQVFQAAAAKRQVPVKTCAKKHAVWLTANQLLAVEQLNCGENTRAVLHLGSGHCRRLATTPVAQYVCEIWRRAVLARYRCTYRS